MQDLVANPIDDDGFGHAEIPDRRDALDVGEMPAGVERDGCVDGWRASLDGTGGRAGAGSEHGPARRSGTGDVLDRQLHRSA